MLKYIVLAYDAETAAEGEPIDLFSDMLNTFDNAHVKTAMVESDSLDGAVKQIADLIPRLTAVDDQFYECGICGHYHSPLWSGDCREDENRFTAQQLDDKFGAGKWAEVPMPGGDLAPAASRPVVSLRRELEETLRDLEEWDGQPDGLAIIQGNIRAALEGNELDTRSMLEDIRDELVAMGVNGDAESTLDGGDAHEYLGKLLDDLQRWLKP